MRTSSPTPTAAGVQSKRFLRVACAILTAAAAQPAMAAEDSRLRLLDADEQAIAKRMTTFITGLGASARSAPSFCASAGAKRTAPSARRGSCSTPSGSVTIARAALT